MKAEINMPEILDCGHIPTVPRSDLSTGYGRTIEGKRHCFHCCAANDLTNMTRDGRITLYLVRNANGRYEVTNWPGTLRIPVIAHTESKRGGGFGSNRVDAWFRGPEGVIWHAINRGDNEIARCKRTTRTKL